MKESIPDDKLHLTAAIAAYFAITRRLYAELSASIGAENIDIDAIEADLLNEAKKAVPQGQFEQLGTGFYDTMFKVISGFCEEARNSR
ncbi:MULTISPECIES: hypothetical protein [unclassified Roseibium]|uniref:hypothetical protein n=1 Tax=unclassified Roseibium TaxID=2629323 RepID=UPI00273E85E6|nr:MULTISPECIES: hypothetical protein [unclassified Roseibium]